MRIDTQKDFKLVFTNYYSAICRFIFSYVNDIEVAEDIAQDSFVRAYESKENFCDLNSIKSFLYRIAHNLSIDYLKHKQVSEAYSKYIFAEGDKIDEQLFLKEVTRQETIRLLYDSINKLPNRTKQIIMLSLKGYSNSEISIALDISVNTVKTLKKIGYSDLRKSLSAELFSLLVLYINN
jgi:RNA polymerase sigma-70 factor (family 1)